MKVKQIFLVLITITNLSAQNWSIVNSPTNIELNDIFFLTDQKGWIVGKNGVVLSTMNGGINWEIQTTGTYKNLYSIFFIDEIKGFAVGADGVILITIDGGKNWEIQSNVTDLALFDIQFLNKNVGYIAGGSIFDGIILKTTDNGANWSSITPQYLIGTYRDLFFLNEQEGWIAGGKNTFDNFSGNAIIHTANGGNNWEEFSNKIPGPLYGIHFFNNKLGWAVGDSPLGFGPLKTNDGGKTWNTIRLQKGDLAYSDFYRTLGFYDSLNIWIPSNMTDTIYQTNDGGKTWKNEIMPRHININSMCFLSTSKGFAVGNGGFIFKYDNIVSVHEETNKVYKNYLSANYPNPFNSQTTILFELDHDGFISIKVYDLLGRLVKTAVEGFYHQGKYVERIKMSDLSSGTYFYQLQFDGSIETKKMQLTKYV